MPDLPWFPGWIARHMARFSGHNWPPVESDQFAIMAQSWLHHFAKERVSEGRAEAGSIALLAIQHYPTSHFAALLAAIPEAPPECEPIDHELEAHYAKGDAILRERRKAEAEARELRSVNFEANRARALAQIEALRARGGAS